MQYDLQNSLLTDLRISKKRDFQKPSSWQNIRKNAPDNCIRLFVDDRYPIGFVATVTGGYSINIDGEHYADYSSEAQFSISDWTAYTDTQGYAVDYPTGATKAHIIDIYPQTENENITAFCHQRVDDETEHEEQGTLWIHFNISNTINLNNMCSPYPYSYKVNLLKAVTAKNNKLTLTGDSDGTFHAESLSYIPILDGIKLTSVSFYSNSLEKVNLKDPVLGAATYCFTDCHLLKDIKINNPTYDALGFFQYFANNTMLKTFPNIDWSKVVQGTDMWTDYNRAGNNGTPTVIDARAGTQIKILGLHDTNTLIGLRVSNQAPFDSSTTPQLDVHNTALDRQALVTLFNDLPTVTDGQIIDITGCTGTANLTNDDKAIATNKGWTINE